MAMGGQRSAPEQALFVATSEISTAENPFYRALNGLLGESGFDEFTEDLCPEFYAGNVGRPGIPPGVYFRMMVGYLEGIGALKLLDDSGLLSGGTLGVDSTTLEANAAMRSIVRRDEGTSYEEWLRELARASGIETPTREELAKLDRKRSKKGSNAEWVHLGDPEARIAKMKDGRTHLAAGREAGADVRAPAGDGRIRRVHVREQEEIRKRMLIHVAAFNLGLLMRKRFGAGTPQGLPGRPSAAQAVLLSGGPQPQCPLCRRP